MLAAQATASVKKHPYQATDSQEERYPSGRPRGGENERPKRTDALAMIMARSGTMNQNTEQNICSCGKVLKNNKGLRIHQGRMGCLNSLPPTQRKEQSHKTVEEPGQEAHHSARGLIVEEVDRRGSRQEEVVQEEDLLDKAQAPKQEPQARLKQIKWPKANEKNVWQQFDDDIDKILDSALSGEVDRKIKAMGSIMYSVAAERFGTVENKRPQQQPHKVNRRTQQIGKIRVELRALTKQYKQAGVNEKAALEELRECLREKLKTLRRAEGHRRRCRDREKKRASFTKNPFKFTTKLLGDKRSGSLKVSREEVEQYLKKTYNDPNRETPLGEYKDLHQPERPEKQDFDMREPTLKEARDVIKKARSGSAPGPNGIAYKVYKSCEKITSRLWRLLRVIWRRGKLADSWMEAEGCFVPKEEDSENLGQFRTISLLNVEGKIFLAILSKRLTDYFLNNKYIDVSVQKGGIPGFSGCLEHISVLTQLLREARENKGDLAVMWLDLANAYGSIPHKLVETTLQRHYLPSKVINLIAHYYDNIKIRFTVGEFTTAWQRLEVGIVTGCTISVILFAAAMYMVIRSVEKKSRGPVTASSTKQPPIRAFMDDLTITTRTVIEARWTLQELANIIKWAHMKFKPTKSRSLVLKKGKVENKYRFKVEDQTIPTVTEKTVKSLGKMFVHNLNDIEAVKETRKQVTNWMEAIDRSGLPGKFKAWCYQHGVLPRLLWPLLVYEVPLTAVETMEQTVSKYLRKWLGVPKSLSNIQLYGKQNKLQLPFKGITEEFKATKARKVMILKDSKDEKVSQCGIQIKTGRKWSAASAVQDAEERLRHGDIVGTVTHGRSGLGCITRTRWSTASPAQRRQLVQQEVRKMVEEERQAKTVSMKQQGKWMKWEGAIQRKVTWADLWSTESNRISFLIRAVYDILPSPTNLHMWGKIEEPHCKLCGKPASLRHILSSCSRALADGRYTWRHDQVLKALAEGLEEARKKEHKLEKKLQYIPFVKGGQSKSTSTKAHGLLVTASDWSMSVDLHRKLVFPEEILVTSKRPDIVLWSSSAKKVILIELTVPWEERMEESNELKRDKYSELVTDIKNKGWSCWCQPVEVGCRGFASSSMWKTLSLLGVCGRKRNTIIRDMCNAAEIGSRWVWMKREEAWSHSAT